MSDAAKILILTDGKAGHENQSKAFARALGRDAEIVKVAFKSKAAKLLSYLADRLGIGAPGLFRTERAVAGDFAAVVGTGSGTFYAAKTLARRLGVKVGVVLYPRGYDLATFDCVMAPVFDNPAPRPNVVTIPANLVANDAAFYDKGVDAFAAHYLRANGRPLATDGAPAVAVIVGGPNKCSTLTPAWMKARLDEVFAANAGARLWVTTSRRTPKDVEAVVDSYPWDYRLIYSRDQFNPIPAFVKLANRLYVTAESTGMLSESCTCGTAAVFALDNLKPGPHKFRRFVDGLTAAGYLGGNRKVDLTAEFAAAKRLLGL
ncbi:MAG: mitochondrial fission ELM1 family protein [Kiritimatiellae bacterium]|nr:mitochondrial fission ELM1 family protein [Kiritimatiellia bacterium]